MIIKIKISSFKIITREGLNIPDLISLRFHIPNKRCEYCQEYISCSRNNHEKIKLYRQDEKDKDE